MASADAKKDIAFVRKEKQDDTVIAQKLEEIYGKVAAARDNGYRRSKKGWACPSCGYVNFESRLACGECLDVHPEVVEGTKFATKRRTNNSDTSSNYTTSTATTKGATTNSTVSGTTAEDVLKRVPNMKEPGVSFDKHCAILQISDRCYRIANFPNTAVALGRKKAIAKANAAEAAAARNGGAARPAGEDDANDDGEDDGFGTCSSDDGDDGEDGPRGGCGAPAFVPSHAAGETLDDYGDEECDGNSVYGNDDDNTTAPSCSNDNDAVRIRQDKTSGQYVAHMYVSPLLYGFIIGKQGSTLAETQRMTNTIIKVPKQQQQNGKNDDKNAVSSSMTPSEAETIVISGPDRASVTAAVVKIEALVMQNRSRVGYTHFLSIPLGKDKAFRERAEKIISDMKGICISEAHKIDETLFQTPSWMHFTVLVLRLHSHRDLQLAKKLLQTDVLKAAEKYFGPSSSSSASPERTMRLKGLNIMNDDPTEVNVLFAEPRTEHQQEGTHKGVPNLLRLIAEINEIFTKNDLCQRHDVAGNDKLHATLMNTKFRQSAMATAASNNGGGAKSSAALPPRIPFDASNVLAAFKEADFGDYTFTRMELSRMNDGDGSSTANRARLTYYGCEDAIEF